MLDQTTFSQILSHPATPYVLVLGIFFVVISLISWLIRRVFRRLRILTSAVIVSIVLSLITGKVALNPFVSQSNNPIVSAALQQTASGLNGFFSRQFPILAYKFEESETASETIANDEPVQIKVQYLPFGELVVQYDQQNGEISLVEGLDQTDNTFLSTLFSQAKGLLPNT